MASQYQKFLDAGVRIVGVSVDSPAQHAAMIEKLDLPFALLSDPGGEGLLQALDAYNPEERGGIGKPGVFVVAPGGAEVSGPKAPPHLSEPKAPGAVVSRAERDEQVSREAREVFREVGRDFADRITEDELLDEVRGLGLPRTDQPPLTPGDPQPGPNAMPVEAMLPYCRGARFAAKAMGMRYPEAKADADRYVEQMDRYRDAIRGLMERTGV